MLTEEEGYFAYFTFECDDAIQKNMCSAGHENITPVMTAINDKKIIPSRLVSFFRNSINFAGKSTIKVST